MSTPASAVPLELDAVNSADGEGCAAALAPLFEGAPRFLARLCQARPFAAWSDLLARAREIARAMPEADQIELVNAHPRLGAPPAHVSAMSLREQGYDRGTSDAIAELAELNDAYERRFGFRYCTFVAGRPRAALLPEFRDRLRGERDDELRRALDAVVDIAEDRLARLRVGAA